MLPTKKRGRPRVNHSPEEIQEMKARWASNHKRKLRIKYANDQLHREILKAKSRRHHRKISPASPFPSCDFCGRSRNTVTSAGHVILPTMNPRELAQYWGYHVNTFYKYLRAGLIPSPNYPDLSWVIEKRKGIPSNLYSKAQVDRMTQAMSEYRKLRKHITPADRGIINELFRIFLD
jgi:hypothetical protein